MTIDCTGSGDSNTDIVMVHHMNGAAVALVQKRASENMIIAYTGVVPVLAAAAVAAIKWKRERRRAERGMDIKRPTGNWESSDTREGGAKDKQNSIE